MEKAVHAYIEAGYTYLLVNQEDGLMYLDEAVTYLVQLGHFRLAGKIEYQMANIYEIDGEMDNAISHYRKSANYYKSANVIENYWSSMVKVAKFTSNLNVYDEAIQIWESYAKYCYGHNLLKFNTKDLFLNAFLTRLASLKEDSESLKECIKDYSRVDYTFRLEKQGRFAMDLIKCLKTVKITNFDMFMDCVYDYDCVSKLDPWQITMLGRVKDKLLSQLDAVANAQREKAERERKAEQEAEEAAAKKKKKAGLRKSSLL
jgi:alpha-soluble NSF attachment protein